MEELSPNDPRPLLTAGYEAVRRDPQRLASQLDLLAAVSAQVRLLALSAPVQVTPAALADALLTELA